MPTPRLDQLSIDLSKLLVDEVAAPATNGKDFTSSQRLLALNRAEGIFLSRAAVEQTVQQLAKNLNELIRETTGNIVGGNVASPVGSIRVVKAMDDGTDLRYFIYVKPEDWYAVVKEYNADEKGTSTNPRFTEFNKTVFVRPDTSLTLRMMYIKDHV